MLFPSGFDRIYSYTSIKKNQQTTELNRSNISVKSSNIKIFCFLFSFFISNSLLNLYDEKRTQMSEPSIEEMRHLFAELGATSSASFVLDGPSFTKERVVESFDGIHYPPSVYDGE